MINAGIFRHVIQFELQGRILIHWNFEFSRLLLSLFDSKRLPDIIQIQFFYTERDI